MLVKVGVKRSHRGGQRPSGPPGWVGGLGRPGYVHVGGEDAVDEVQLGQKEGALQLVVVEGHLAGPGAVQAGLHEGGPRVLQQEPPPDVVLADPGGPGEHGFPTVVLHGVFSEKEVGEIPDVVR